MQLPVIDCNQVPLSIPGHQILDDLGCMSFGSVRGLASIYLTVGGDRSLSFPEDVAIAKVASDLEMKIEKKAQDTLKEAYKFQQERVTAIEWNSFVITSGKQPKLVVGIELPCWTYFSTCWFDHLKSSKPAVYDLIKGIITRCAHTMPVRLTNTYIDEHDIESMFEDDPKSQSVMMEERENLEVFTAAKPVKVPELRAIFQKVMRKMTPDEKRFARDAFAVFDLDAKIPWRKLPWVHDALPDELTNRPSTDMAFTIAAGDPDHSGIVQMLLDDSNEVFGEYGPPVILFNITKPTELLHIKNVIRFYQELQKLFFFINTTFGREYEKKVAKLQKNKEASDADSED